MSGLREDSIRSSTARTPGPRTTARRGGRSRQRLVDSGLQRIGDAVAHGVAKLLSALAAGRHAVVVSTVRLGGRSIHAVPLIDEELVLVGERARATRIDRERLARLGAAELRAVPLVPTRRTCRSSGATGAALSGSARWAGPRWTCPICAVRASTVAGAGVAVLPTHLCREEVRRGDLVVLLEPAEPPIDTLYLAIRAAWQPDASIAAVRRHLTMSAGLLVSCPSPVNLRPG